MVMHGITKKRQRKAVKYFQRYLIQDGHTPKAQNLFDDDMTAEYMIENFDVQNDKIDRRILYELTGRKLDPEDYWDDSDQDQELDRFAETDPNKVSDYAEEITESERRNADALEAEQKTALIRPRTKIINKNKLSLN